MNYTKAYFEQGKRYRATLADIWAKHEQTVSSLEQYKGSRGYDEQMAEAAKERDKAIRAAQEAVGLEFTAILTAMKKNALGHPMTAPTQEQLNLLTVLKMREHVSKDELRQAASALEGSPACLAVLKEIADKNEYLGLSFGKETPASILEHIESLADSARRLCKLEKPNSRHEQVSSTSIYSREYRPDALYSFRVDRDFSNEADCMSIMGGVVDYESFSAAVNS